MADELVTVPTDLTLLSDEELAELEVNAVAEFDRLKGLEISPQVVEAQLRMSDDIDRVRIELTARKARAAAEADHQRTQMLEQRDRLEARVHGHQPGDAGGGGAVETAPADVAAITEAAARGATAALVAAIGERRGLTLEGITQRANASLADARRFMPEVVTPPRRLAVTAGVDIPGIGRNDELTDIDSLVNAFQRAAKSMPVTRDGSGQERLVATIRNEYEHVVDDRTSPGQVEDVLRYLRRPEKMQALVAGGGWCAPSEIRYEFFNVAGADGLVDLPTVGITRGGLRFPTSPSIADAFGSNGLAPFAVSFSNTSDPWLWTEADDILAVTGASPRKTSIRVACPSFNEARLECYGVTMTAGNLTDDAYPEATAHTLRLLLTAWQHAQNARIISQMVALSGTAITGIGSAGKPVYQTVLNGISLATTDYRAKYAIPDAVVLEAVAPYWLKDVIRADLAWRAGPGTDLLSVTDAQINGYFADRNVRVQWVNDYQVRGASQFGNASTPMVAWPTAVDVLVYAAGTFIKGNGLTLDLGVVRDSTLNATNDFTAAWSEECHLVARVGNESRRYTLTFAVDGATGGSAYALGSPAAQI